MVMSPLPQSLHVAMGVIEEVDVLARALRVQVDGVSRAFDVAPDCVIHLYGEPVKLRLLQPRDVVHVMFTREDDATVAHAGSGTRWYCWPKKFPNASPGFKGHTTWPSRGNAPTISGVPRA